jgi:5'-nucleotidase (lipoprotein e(P4) family)
MTPTVHRIRLPQFGVYGRSRRRKIGEMSRNALLLLLIVSSAACQSARGAPPVVTSPTAPPVSSPAAPASDPDSIRWVRDSAEYQAALLQVYRQATARVEAEARTRTGSAWAVILDADETVISNATYQSEHLPFTQESWTAWVRRREATPLPGAADFLSRVHALGGRIAIVTNRLQSECADTQAVFKTHALVYDAMLCRPDGSPSDKNPRFEAVANGRTPAGASPLDVLAFVGDNILDFPHLTQASKAQGAQGLSEFGVRFFLVPNPMYGSWQ